MAKKEGSAHRGKKGYANLFSWGQSSLHGSKNVFKDYWRSVYELKFWPYVQEVQDDNEFMINKIK